MGFYQTEGRACRGLRLEHRVHVLHRSRRPHRIAPMTAKVIGKAQGVGVVPAGILALVSQVSSFISSNGGQLEQLFGQGNSFFSGIASFLGIGPSYNPSNGGEVARQLGPTGTNTLHLGMGQAYVDWVKKYAPGVWDGTVDMWTAPGLANNSAFYDHYRQLLAAGMPDGALLDQQGVPLGLNAAVRQINAFEAQQEGASLTAADDGGDVTPPNPTQQDNQPPSAGINYMPLVLAGAAILLLSKR